MVHKLTHDDAEWRDEDTDGEGDTDPAERDDALVALEEEQGKEEDGPEEADVEAKHDLCSEPLSFLVCVDEVHDYVDTLNNDAGCVDGDEEELVGLDQRVEDPQHRAEQRHHIGNRLETLGRLALVDAVECRADYTNSKNANTFNLILNICFK